MKKVLNSKTGYLVLCILFVVAIIIFAMSASYAFFKGQYTKINQTQTKIKNSTFNITTDLPEKSALVVTDLPLIEESEIAEKSVALNFEVSSSNNQAGGNIDIYLKDIAISPKLIDTFGSFKWQLLEGSTIVASGSFNDIETNGVASTTLTNTESTLYFDKYYLKREVPMATTETKNYIFRVYLLNDPNGNQIELANQSFECKVAVDAYTSVN